MRRLIIAVRTGRTRFPPRTSAPAGCLGIIWALTVALLLTMLQPALAKTAAQDADPSPPAAQPRETSLVAPEIQRILERGELVVAMAGLDTPPFFYREKGALVGLEVDMARELAAELKVAVRFDRSARSFNEVIDLVAKHRADLGISKLSRTLSRAESVRFSEPYMRLKHALALNRVAVARMAKDRPIQALVRDFRGTLGVIRASAFADFATRHFPKAQLRRYPNWAALVRAVEAGMVVAAYRDEFEVKRLMRSDASAPLSLRTVTLSDLEDTLGIAVNRSDADLLEVVNLFLSQRQTQLTLDRVLQAAAP